MIYNVNTGNISELTKLLKKKAVIVIASHDDSGEEKLLSDLIQYYDQMNLRTHVWDFYSSSRCWVHTIPAQFDLETFKCRMTIHDIPLINKTIKKPDTNQVLREITEIDDNDIIMLIGFQMMQMNPYEPEEAALLMERLKTIATSRTIIVYSRLFSVSNNMECRDSLTYDEWEAYSKARLSETATPEKLEMLGIKAENTIILEKLDSYPLIGPFFYIGDKLISQRACLYDGRKQADKLDYPYSHEAMFYQMILPCFTLINENDETFPFVLFRHQPDPQRITKDMLKKPMEVVSRLNLQSYLDVNGTLSDDYIDYPRGRVIYDCTAKKSIVYIDSCIDTPEIREEISILFKLGSNFSVRYDEHYRCKKCVGKLFDWE